MSKDVKDAAATLSQNQKSIISFCIGGIAGCASKTAVAPLDRLKILLQCHNPLYHNLRPVSAFIKIFKNDGFIGFYQGNWAQMIRIFPYAAIQYYSYGKFKEVFHYMGWQSQYHYEKAICGSFAGVTAVAFTYPLDLVRARIAFENRLGLDQVSQIHTNQYSHPSNRGVWAMSLYIFRQEGGSLGLYRGFSATLVGMIPYAGISFFTFERLKGVLLRHCCAFNLEVDSSMNQNKLMKIGSFFCESMVEKSSNLDSHDLPKLTIYGRLCCGALAGLAAQIVSYPIDVTRRRMQLPSSTLLLKNVDGPPRIMPWHKVLARTLREYGVFYGLYRGVTLNFFRVVPMTAVSFTTYETLCHWANIPTST